MAILVSDKADFRGKKITTDREECYIMTKRSIHREDTAILNVLSSNNRVTKSVEEKMIKWKGEIDKSIYLETSTSLSQQLIEQPRRNSITQSTNRIPSIYRTFHPTTAKYTFFSIIHGTYTKTDNILGHKTNLNTFKRTEIIQSTFYDHNEIKLESSNNYTRKISKHLKMKHTSK